MTLKLNYKLNYRFILIFFTACIIQSCTNKISLPVLEIKDGFHGKIGFDNIRLVGPFLYDSTKTNEINSLDEDNLSYFGLREDSLTEEDYLKITYESAINKKFLHPEFRNTEYPVPADNIDFIHLIDTAGTDRRESNFYLACNIRSDKDQSVVFLASTCFGMKVWLNNQLIIKETGELSFPKGFDYYMLLPLKKGNNLVLIKMNRGINKLCWRLVSKIADIKTAKEEFGINSYTDFIVNPIVKNHEKLNIYVGGYLKDENIQIEIIDNIDQTKIYNRISAVVNDEGNCQFDVSELANDFYKCRLILPNDTFIENFYHGEIEQLYNKFNNEIKTIKTTNEADIASLNGVMKRFNYLLHKPYRLKSKSEVKFNDKNIVISAFAIRNILQNVNTNKNELFKNAKGTYLRAYKSEIDGQYQYYMFHVSEKVLAQKKIPLVVVMPFFHNPLDSILKSWYLSNTDQIEWEIRLADENGFALFWPYLRGNSASSPISNTDFFEAFEDVKQNYNIDPDRVFLMGDCAGATRSVLLASRYPGMFAGLSLFQPETETDDATNSPINFAGNVSNIPIYIYHSTKDEVIPIKNSEDFIDEAAKYGYKPYFDKSEEDSHYLLPKNCHYPIFQFFRNKRRNQSPDTIYFTTYEQKYNKAYWILLDQFSYIGKTVVKARCDSKKNTIHINTVNIEAYSILTENMNIDENNPIKIYTNGELSYHGKIQDTIKISLKQRKALPTSKNVKIEGPISHFFADKFVYVEPNSGPSISKTISEKWGKMVFFGINTIKEGSFNAFYKNYNIILFNDQYSNPEIRHLISALPFTYKDSKLIFRNKEIEGTKLSFCFIYPNPLNKNKYVLYIGTEQPVDFKLIEKNQLTNGSFDYIIWSGRYGSNQIISEGYFDLRWQ